MKKYIYCLTAFFTVVVCSAQLSVSQAEYYWDTDPGEGSGTAISATDGSFNSAFEKISIAGLGAPSVGLHKFCVRVKDNTGIWSPVAINVVKVEATTSSTPVSLSQAEYFWDADPGEGSATALLAIDGNFNSAFEKIAVSGLGAPSVGLHKFSVRVKDNQGVWGPAFTNIIVVQTTVTPTPISLAQAEYFWDTDPGEGSGTAFAAADGNFNSSYEELAQTAISIVNPIGLHVFNLRVKDNQGVWSPAFKNVIYIESTLASEHFDLSHLLLYPNPVKDILNVSYDKTINSVTIYNALGQQVIAESVNANSYAIGISNLTFGTYFIKVTTDNVVKCLKFIKE